MNSKITALLAGAAIGVFAFAGTAHGHTPQVAPSCTGLSVNLAAYEGSSPNNRVTTTIDGIATVANFGGSYTHQFGWPQTAAHSWSVVIDANRTSGNATQYDAQFSGTQQPCQVPPTTAVTTTTTAATTTTAVTTTTVPVVTTVPSDPTTTVVEIITPPVPCVYNVALPADSPLCVPPVQPPAVSTGSSGLGLSTPQAALPATGTTSSGGLVIAFGLVLAGAGCAGLARRRAS